MARPPIAALQLATLVDTAPDGDAWIHERKYDGYRILADKTGGQVTLYSRRFHDWTARMPEVAAAVAALPIDRAVLDGEVAIVMPDGRTSFQALQGAFGGGGPRPTYFVFDLLAADDADVAALPLEDRKRRLAALVAKAPRAAAAVVRYSDHVIGGGPAFFRAACEIGLEGIVSKRRDAPYAPGRGTSWVKTKCVQRQELVIGGFTEPSGSRTGLGALLVGYYRDGALVYAGKVGTGFTAKTLAELEARLARARSTTARSRRCRRGRGPVRAATGSVPTSSPRSRSPSGPPTGGYVTRRSRACAPTRRRPRSAASALRRWIPRSIEVEIDLALALVGIVQPVHRVLVRARSAERRAGDRRHTRARDDARGHPRLDPRPALEPAPLALAVLIGLRLRDGRLLPRRRRLAIRAHQSLPRDCCR